MHDVVVVQTGSQDDRPGPLRKDASLVCTKGHEVPFEIALQVRQLASIEGHGSVSNQVGTASQAVPARAKPGRFQ